MLHVSLDGYEMEFDTDPALFSPGGPDQGTLAMLRDLALGPDEKALDLGCGWGLVGVYLGKRLGEDRVLMTDIDPRAVDIAAANAARNGLPGLRTAVSDGFDALDETGFTLILSNPPYHADFAVARRMIEKGFNRLALGGRMRMVTRRKLWYRNKFIAVFGGVRITESDGYFVFEAQKRSVHYAGAKPGKGR